MTRLRLSRAIFSTAVRPPSAMIDPNFYAQLCVRMRPNIHQPSVHGGAAGQYADLRRPCVIPGAAASPLGISSNQQPVLRGRARTGSIRDQSPCSTTCPLGRACAAPGPSDRSPGRRGSIKTTPPEPTPQAAHRRFPKIMALHGAALRAEGRRRHRPQRSRAPALGICRHGRAPRLRKFHEISFVRRRPARHRSNRGMSEPATRAVRGLGSALMLIMLACIIHSPEQIGEALLDASAT